jgi:hypothetical protein
MQHAFTVPAMFLPFAIQSNGPIIRDGLQPSVTVWLYQTIVVTFHFYPFLFFSEFLFFLARRHPQMEFQAIVLADHDDGSGTRLYPLLEKTPKSLLPIAGRPLIAYQLALLERSGFKEVGGARCAAPGMRSRSACPGL